MIWGRNIREVFKKHRLEILRLYNQELNQKITTANLVHRYTDQNGVAYFGFPKDYGLPVERLGKLYHYTELLFKGLTVSEDEAIDDAIEGNLEAGLKNSKNKSAAKIGALLIERKKRRGIILHHELIYNIIAVQWIREDEQPGVFVNEIQLQKVDQFQKECEGGNTHPFFQAPELRQLNSFLQMSNEEWQQSLRESQMKAEVLKEALKILSSSESDSGQSRKTSTAG